MGFAAKLMDALRGARKAEIMLVLALVCVLALAWVGKGRLTADAATDLERRMEKALEAVNGAGEVKVMITQGADGTVTGALVVAEGADDIAVRLEMLRAVRTLTGIEAERIDIARMGGG